MKKIISIFTLVFLILSMSVINTYASNDISVDVVYNAETNSFLVSGNVSSERNRIPMTLQIKKGAELVGVSEILAVTKTADGVSYSFSPVAVNASTGSGTLTINVTASRIDKSKAVTFEYKGIDSQLEALKQINSAGISDSISTMYDKFISTSDDLSIKADDYTDLSERGKDELAKHLIRSSGYILPNNCDTEENCFIIREAVIKYQKDVKEAVAIGKFFSLDSQSVLKDWVSVYKDEYKLYENTEKVNEYIDYALNTNGFINRCNQLDSVKDMSDLKALFIEQAALQNIESSNYTVVSDVISEFSKDLSVNYTKWNKLNGESKAEVCLEVAGKNYNSFDLFSQAVNAALNTSDNPVSSGVPSTGGSFGGGGGGAVSVSKDIIPQTNPAKPVVFSDVDNSHWAFEPIQYLYSKGIVSGRGNGNFAPSDYVTRAELSKMIALAMKLSSAEGAPLFSDVDASMWYAPYVSAVAEKGIVLGDDNGSFNPYGLVTRQDTLVMLYRAIGSPVSESKAYFEDYADISDYAKSAVDYMCFKGVVNGIGDGIFAPKATLTRAEAAKIIYIILTK